MTVFPFSIKDFCKKIGLPDDLSANQTYAQDISKDVLIDNYSNKAPYKAYYVIQYKSMRRSSPPLVPGYAKPDYAKKQTQSNIAEATGISAKAVQNTKKGESLLSTYVAILRVLRSLDQLDNFLP